MTMPKTAAAMKALPNGVLPEELSDADLQTAIKALSMDLPGDPIVYIEHAAPNSKLCECGAVHLCVDAADMNEETRGSLHRLLATPYGDLAREHMRRKSGYSTIRFGWSGIDKKVPTFVKTVCDHDAQNTPASSIDQAVLIGIIDAFKRDMPDVMHMIERSAASISALSVSPQPGEAGRAEWKALIDRVMFAWSTPVRKYLSEWLSREFGLYGGAVNCCIVMTARMGNEIDWRRQWIQEQTNQQLTPDC